MVYKFTVAEQKLLCLLEVFLINNINSVLKPMTQKSDRFTSFPTFFPSSPECQTGDVGTLLLSNPVGQNGLDFPGLLYEAAKVFGLRSRRVKLYLDQDFTQGKMERKMVDILTGLLND